MRPSLLKMNQVRLVFSQIKKMSKTSRLNESKNFIQHGTTSVFTHCRNVALVSLVLAKIFKRRVDQVSLVRGALLHDYFLYDWHNKADCPHLHGFVHPEIALKNASEVFDLSPTEKDIIAHHMFPLTLEPPKTREGWIITLADKICGIYETLKLNESHIRHRNKIFKKFCRKNNKDKINYPKIFADIFLYRIFEAFSFFKNLHGRKVYVHKNPSVKPGPDRSGR